MLRQVSRHINEHRLEAILYGRGVCLAFANRTIFRQRLENILRKIIVQTLTNLGSIDRCQLLVHPVVLGNGELPDILGQGS